MKILYVSRFGKDFIGGADNLSGFLIDAFVRKFNLKENPITYAEPIASYEEMEGFSNYDIIFAESSALPSTDDLLKLSDKTLRKMHVYMHSTFLAQENDLSDGVLGPSAWDVKDATGILHLIQRGITPYFGSRNHVAVVNFILNEVKAEYLDISEFRSRNTNLKFPKIDDSFRKNNAVLFTTGYYHPGVGIHILMKMIQSPEADQFEWYIVGRPFDVYYRITDGKLWSDVYSEVLRKSNVHLIDFTSDLSYYYKLCKFNLIISKSDSYSFKAIEALSYGCINVTTEGNNLLMPWARYAIIAHEDRDLTAYARNFIEKLVDFKSAKTRDLPRSLQDLLESFKELDERAVYEYLSNLLGDILINSREFLYDTDIEKSYWKYNRLK